MLLRVDPVCWLAIGVYWFGLRWLCKFALRLMFVCFDRYVTAVFCDLCVVVIICGRLWGVFDLLCFWLIVVAVEFVFVYLAGCDSV